MRQLAHEMVRQAWKKARKKGKDDAALLSRDGSGNEGISENEQKSGKKRYAPKKQAIIA
jgi:hypothetical protein